MSTAQKTDVPATSAPAPSAPAAPAKAPLIPVLLVVALVPVLCYGVTSFVLLPKLKSAIVAELGEGNGGASTNKASGESKSASHGSSEKKSGKAGEHSVEFGSTVVNLAGAMGQRFLRTNFVVAGSDAKLEEIIKSNQSALKDVAINVLSSQSMAALENPGAKNLVRSELLTQFNRTLGAEVVEQIYFSEFVVQ